MRNHPQASFSSQHDDNAGLHNLRSGARVEQPPGHMSPRLGQPAGAQLPHVHSGVAALLMLQRTIGNRNVNRLVGAEAVVLPPPPVPVGQREEPGGVEPETPETPGPGEAEEPELPTETQEEGEEEPVEGVPAPTTPQILALSRVGRSRPVSRTVNWGAGAGIGPPRPVSWAALPRSDAAPGSNGAAAVGPPVGTGVLAVQKEAGSVWALGWTYFPKGYKAPTFLFNSKDTSKGKGPAKWVSSPKLTGKAFEGNGGSFFVTPGVHKTAHVEAGLPVFWNMPKGMSTRDRNAEQEHVNDTYFAYKISLKEAQSVLTKHVHGKNFGPKASQADAEQLVLDTITANLPHKALGNDQTKWAAKYDALFRQTLQRDTKGWHTFNLSKRVATKKTVTYTISTGTTNVGTVPSSKLIKY